MGFDHQCAVGRRVGWDQRDLIGRRLWIGSDEISRTSPRGTVFCNRLRSEGTPQVSCLLPYALPCLTRTQYLRLYTPFTWLRIMLVLGENMFWGVCAPMLITEHRISPQGRAVGVRMLQ